MDVESYEKPQITDFGTLEEVTAGCAPNADGDYASYSANYTDSLGNHCSS